MQDADGTYFGNLAATGLTCLVNGTITGNVTESSGSFVTSNAKIDGNLQISGGSISIDSVTTINGNLQISNSSAASAPNRSAEAW
jgi:cytoskeletal protein CcmA (bactofilin family)